jgi:tight adherence protein B
LRRYLSVVSLIVIAAVFLLADSIGAIAAPNGDLAPMTIRKVDKSAYPKVTLHLGLTTAEKVRDFTVKENGRSIKNIQVTSHDDKKPVAVTLLIDVSGSMEGEPLEQAKKAAKLFVERARSDDRIAVVAFSTEVDRAANFTGDKEALSAAIDGLEAGGETAVFDALQEALEAGRAENSSELSMIVLSDGGDTASKAQGAAVAELAEKLKVPISAIALESPELDKGPLKEVAERSGGRLITAVSSEALVDLYDGLAAELHNRYQVTFTSQTKKARTNIEVETRVDGRRVKAATTLAGIRPSVKPKAEPKPESAPRVSVAEHLSGSVSLWVAVLLAFAAVFIGVLALGDLLRPGRNTLAEQLKYYDQLHGRSPAEPGEPVFDRLKKSLVEFIKIVSVRYQFNEYAQKKLEQAGLPLRPNEYIAVHLMAVIGTGLAGVLLGAGPTIRIILIVAMTVGPLLAVQIKIDRRRAAFTDQLPDVLDMLAGSLRAGYGVQQAITAAGRDTQEPMAGELKRAAAQIQMGMTLEDALKRMSDRIGDPAFQWVVLSISIHRETGGNLAEIFDNLANSLRQRERMRRQIKALTAEGRYSAYILLVLPFVEAALMFVLNPEYMSVLFTTVPGLVMAGMSLLLMTGGALWLKAITDIDY